MSSEARILVTGATGFVGGHLIERMQQLELPVAALGRSKPEHFQGTFIQADLTDLTGLSENDFQGIDTVVHLAARAHVMNEQNSDPRLAYIQANTEATLELAKRAAAAGVKRFIFLSSIKVNGEKTPLDQPFRHTDNAAPEDDYGHSKLLAEQGLQELSAQTGMTVVVIRPPLVYGPGVKGNFERLLSLANSGLPLPLGAVKNKRSMVYVGNLVDLVVHCCNCPQLDSQVLLISDAEDCSTTQLLQHLRREYGRPARLIPIPSSWMYSAAGLLGKKSIVERLCGSLQVDCQATQQSLGWQPPYSLEQGLAMTVTNDKQETSNV